MKQIKLMAGVLLLVGLMAMPAFAGQVVQTSAGNVAVEMLGAARNVSVTGIPALAMTLGNTLQNQTLITLNLTGGAVFMPGVQYFLCANNVAGSANNILTSAVAAAVNTQLPLPITALNTNVANVTLGQTVWLTNDSACNSNGVFNVQIAPTTSTGNVQLSGNETLLGSGSVVLDTFAANNVTKIVNQFSSVLSSADLVTIDYLSGPANGTTLDTTVATSATNLIAMSLNKVVVTNTAPALLPLTGAYNQVLTLSDGLGTWAGINNVYVTSGNCSTPASASANAPASGNITLNIPSITNSAVNNTTLCVQVSGNTSLSSRTISGSYAYQVAGSTTGLNPLAGGAVAVWQSWNPNGYQAFNPYMYVGTDSTTDVFVRLYNNSTRNAHVYVDVYPADGTASTRQALADIPSNEAGTYWGSTIGTNAGLAGGTSYAALFTVTAGKDKVNGVSFFKRSTGERQLPLYKAVTGPGAYLQE